LQQQQQQEISLRWPTVTRTCWQLLLLPLHKPAWVRACIPY
jgi:hypothetical protein